MPLGWLCGTMAKACESCLIHLLSRAKRVTLYLPPFIFFMNPDGLRLFLFICPKQSVEIFPRRFSHSFSRRFFKPFFVPNLKSSSRCYKSLNFCPIDMIIHFEAFYLSLLVFFLSLFSNKCFFFYFPQRQQRQRSSLRQITYIFAQLTWKFIGR